VTVAVVLRGTAAGAEEGGVMHQITSEIDIECPVTDIPEELQLQVNEMQIGDTMTAGQLPLPAGVTLITEPNTPICSVTVVAEEEVEAPAEGEEAAPAEPEVITEAKAEGEEPQEQAEPSNQ